jgi:hypothetical protein
LFLPDFHTKSPLVIAFSTIVTVMMISVTVMMMLSVVVCVGFVLDRKLNEVQ